MTSTGEAAAGRATTGLAAVPGDLPGADLVVRGIRALRSGETTVEALLVSVGATRLRAAGLDIPPAPTLPHPPEISLYLAIGADHPGDAFPLQCAHPPTGQFRTGAGAAGEDRTMRTRFLLLTTPFILAACASDADPSSDGPDVVTETIGDTTVVRTLSGSVWGGEATLVPEVSIGELDGPEEYLFGWIFSIAVDDDHNVYVFDYQAQHVGVFDSEGDHVRTLGRQGEGPGEFNRAEAIALLPDGRLVVRNPGNQRIEVFGPEPGQTEQWGYPAGGLHSGAPLYTDANGRTFVDAPDLSEDDLVTHLIVFGPDGTQVDTLPDPSSEYEPPMLTAERRGVTASGQPTRGSTAPHLPFSPAFLWTVHPSGHFLTGLSAWYRIDLPRACGWR
ncbi:MAG: 6-bladed beta-propeller, partial [Gemmatimonadetes bacterium]|nr:6-bladed beta-propeller [Gemmatimonadota bacterium]